MKRYAAQIALLAKIPILVMFGDHLADIQGGPANWNTSFNSCQTFVKQVADAHGDVEMMHLPAIGIKGPIRAGSPAVVSLTHDQARAIAANPSLRHVPTIWLVTRQSGLFDPDHELPSALAQVRRPGRTQTWGYISVQPFTLFKQQTDSRD